MITFKQRLEEKLRRKEPQKRIWNPLIGEYESLQSELDQTQASIQPPLTASIQIYPIKPDHKGLCFEVNAFSMHYDTHRLEVTVHDSSLGLKRRIISTLWDASNALAPVQKRFDMDLRIFKQTEIISSVRLSNIRLITFNDNVSELWFAPAGIRRDLSGTFEMVFEYSTIVSI